MSVCILGFIFFSKVSRNNTKIEIPHVNAIINMLLLSPIILVFQSMIVVSVVIPPINGGKINFDFSICSIAKTTKSAVSEKSTPVKSKGMTEPTIAPNELPIIQSQYIVQLLHT